MKCELNCHGRKYLFKMKEGNNGEVEKEKGQKLHPTSVRDINFILSIIIINDSKIWTG